MYGLVYKLYLTNREGFGDTGNAIYNSGFQIYVLLLAISSVGVPNAISKLVSEKLAIGDAKGAHIIFKISFVLFAIIGFIGSTILFMGAKYISNVMLQIPEAELTLVALSPSIFFVSISAVIRGYFNGYQSMSVTAKSQTYEQIFKTVFTILIVEIIAILFKTDVIVMAAGANLATTLSIASSFLYLYKYYMNRKKDIYERINNSINSEQQGWKTIVKSLLKISIPASIGSILSAVNRNVDAVTVVRGLKTFLSDSAAKSQYGIYTGKIETLLGIPLALNVGFAIALVPAIAESIAKSKKDVAIKRISFCIIATILIAFPCTIGLIIFSQPILNLLFPNANEGAFILQVGSLTIVFMMLFQTVNGALQGIGKYNIPAIALGVGVVIKFILNIVLIPIPEIGVNGASISSIVCYFVAFSIGYYVLTKNISLNLSFKKIILKPTIATLIMGGLSYMIYTFLGTNNISIIITLIIAVLIYCIALIFLKILNKEEFCQIPYGNKIYNMLVKLKIY